MTATLDRPTNGHAPMVPIQEMKNEMVPHFVPSAPEVDPAILEKVLGTGDLRGLTTTQRVDLYRATCESLGLNPLTRPFDFIELKGKLQMYAKKEATDQLRAMKGISIPRLERRWEEDIYIVTAYAVAPDGRTDTSEGAVFVGNARGEDKANALMKAETKARRRVTLSICGLGWLDDAEVDSIPRARRVQVSSEGVIEGEAAPAYSSEEQDNRRKLGKDIAAALALLPAEQKAAFRTSADAQGGVKAMPTSLLRSFLDDINQIVKDAQDAEIADGDAARDQGQESRPAVFRDEVQAKANVAPAAAPVSSMTSSAESAEEDPFADSPEEAAARAEINAHQSAVPKPAGKGGK